MRKSGLNYLVSSFHICSSIFLVIFLFASPAVAECYSYDDLGRLKTVVYDDANAANRTYNMDEHGNRITVPTNTSGGGACATPSGTASSGATGPLETADYSSPPPTQSSTSNSIPEPDNETIVIAAGANMVVNPLEGDFDADSGDVLSLIGFSEVSPIISVTRDGNSLDVSASTTVGQATITYTVSDGTSTATGLVNVTVTAITPPPTVVDCDETPFLPECLAEDEELQ